MSTQHTFVSLLALLSPLLLPAQSTWPAYPNNETIRITPSGQVGIATSAPAGALGVAGAIVTQPPAGDAIFSAVTPIPDARIRYQATLPTVGTWYWGADGLDAAKWKLSWNTSTFASPTLTATTNGFLGIGASNPLRHLHVYSPTGWPEILLESSYNPAAPGRMWGLMLDATRGALTFRALDAAITSVRNVMTLDANGNVGIGTPTPQYALSVNGAIAAKDVIVTAAGWPDYIFHPAYRLPPLSTIADYVRANRHLPGIPSQTEVAEKGVPVGEMQSKLLAKIEELTLYAIEENRRSEDLARANRDLQRQIDQLKSQVAELARLAALKGRL